MHVLIMTSGSLRPEKTRENSLQGVWLDSPVIRAVMEFFSLSHPEGASDRRDERSQLKCVK